MMTARTKNLLLIILLALISFAIYSNSLSGDFLIDDIGGILQNSRIHDPGVYLSEYLKPVNGVLHELIYVFLWQFSGDNPFFYHLFNVLLHVGCTLLLFCLCNILFANRTLSFLSALIFALHPIHTEAISWISGGHYALSSLFFLLSFIFYVKSDKSILNLFLSISFFIICLFAGHAAATLPVILILYEIFLREKTPQASRLRRVRILVLSAILFLSAIFVATFFVSRNQFIHIIFYVRGFHYLIVAAKALVYYLKILYLPLQRGLYHPFGFNVLNIQNLSPAFCAALLIIIISVILFFKYRKNFKPLSFGIALFFVAYLPYSNIIPVCNIISERYMYLASAGFAIVIAALFLKIWELINKKANQRAIFRALSVVAITLYLGSYAALTLKQNYEYHNIITYWESNINNFKDGYLCYNNLAGTYYRMGNIKNAIIYSWINLMVNPRQPHVWCNLGKIYREQGDIEEARNCYSEALKADSSYFPAAEALQELKSYE